MSITVSIDGMTYALVPSNIRAKGRTTKTPCGKEIASLALDYPSDYLFYEDVEDARRIIEGVCNRINTGGQFVADTLMKTGDVDTIERVAIVVFDERLLYNADEVLQHCIIMAYSHYSRRFIPLIDKKTGDIFHSQGLPEYGYPSIFLLKEVAMKE